MRILSIGNFGTGWDGSICDEEHIAKALEELGHEVVRKQREDTSNEHWGLTLEKEERNNIAFVKEFDFILIAQWDGYRWNDYQDNIANECKRLSKCLVYWAFDYQADGQEWHERLVKGADLYLSKRIADSKYPNWQWLSQDFAPKFLDKSNHITVGEGYQFKDIDVLFTGSYLPWATERNETIKAIGERFNLVIHSVNEWPQGNEGPVMDEGLPELYARAKVVLSIDHTLEAGYWSDRNAQAMACGAFVLFRYVPFSESVFRNNIAYFYSVEDCSEKIENLLRPDIAYIREEYAQKGYEYAQRNLKVKNRVMDLLTIVENYIENRSI